MKKVLITGFLWVLIISYVFSQNRFSLTIVEYGEEVGHHYRKTIENNFWVKYGYYNLSSKIETEKMFFGNFNAPVEFFYEHPYQGAYGFHVWRDSLRKTHILEVKYIPNYIEANKETSDKYKSSSTSIDSMKALSKKIYEEKLKLYKVETFSFSISDQFAEKLYEKILSFIINFKSKGFSGSGGANSTVIFRTVVDNDELWTLRIYTPKGNAAKWSDFCRQIINDAINDQFMNEPRYMFELDKFGN